MVWKHANLPATARKVRSPRLASPAACRSPLWTPQISHAPEPLGGVGRPLSARWREWQSDWRNPVLETRDRWGTAFGNGRALSAPRIPIHGSTLACFERFDLNGSGRLDYRELTRALRQLGLDLSRAEAAEVLAEYDADGSGLMEVDEFARLVHRLGHGAAGDSPHDSWDGFGRHDSRAYGRDSSRDARLVYGGEHSAAYYYLPPEPYLPPARERELTGELRVRVSSSAGRWIASHHSDQPAGKG